MAELRRHSESGSEVMWHHTWQSTIFMECKNKFVSVKHQVHSCINNYIPASTTKEADLQIS